MNTQPVDRDVAAFHAQARKHKHAVLFALIAAVSALFGVFRGCAELATQKEFSQTCHAGNDCASGVCMLRLGDYTGTCTKSCETDMDCGANARCRPLDDGRYCVEIARDGDPCHVDDECRSRVCEASAVGAGRCARSCGQPEVACAEGRYCDRTTLPHGCAAKKHAGAACSQDDECFSGDCSSSDSSTMEAALRTRTCM